MLLTAVLLLESVFSSRAVAQAQPAMHRADFESEPVVASTSDEQLKSWNTVHSILPDAAHSGQAGERFSFQTPHDSPQPHRIVLPVPEARIFHELAASIWLRTNCGHVQLGMRIRFPCQNDPRTNKPYTVDLIGEPSAPHRNWQQLHCRTTDDVMARRMIRARSQFFNEFGPMRFDEREPVVDEVFLLVSLPQGSSLLDLDDFEFGPLVAPVSVRPVPQATPPPRPARLTIVNDRIRKDGEPFFPLFTVYHGESLEEIARTGVNTVWIQDYEDEALLRALESMDIGAIARPPQMALDQTVLQRASIPSFSGQTAPVWAWMLGHEIPGEELDYVSAWARQVRDADRELRRPIFADVSGQERAFHRNVDLIGVSRFGLQTSLSPSSHFEQLRYRRDKGLPGKPPFTFLQTEAHTALLDLHAERGVVPVVEPEQILHQGYEAIAGGFKGIGFWKQIPFTARSPGLDERILAIRIFALHCRLLEPWLATGRGGDPIPVLLDESEAGAKSGGLSPGTILQTRWDRNVAAGGATSDSRIRAVVFQSDMGRFILLTSNEPGSQCVPGAQSAQNVRFLVVGDFNHAFEVTSTSVETSNLDWSRVPGGTEFRLRNFDQWALIVIPEHPREIETLRQKVRSLRRSAAEAWVDLAELKRQRVAAVHAEISGLPGAPTVPQADQLLIQADQLVTHARRELDAEHPDEARLASQRAMKFLRLLQRRHWEAAVDPLTSPVESLDACCFQTLPEHWRLLAEINGRNDLSANRLPSGGFENPEELKQGWMIDQPDNPHFSLRLLEGGAEGHTCLSMMLAPTAPADQRAALLSPPVTVRAGDVVIISGQVRVASPQTHPEQEFLIYETLTGKAAAVRFSQHRENWAPFRMIRRVSADSVLRLRFELNGSGVAHLDDVSVRVLPGLAVPERFPTSGVTPAAIP